MNDSETIHCTPRCTRAEMRYAFLQGPWLWLLVVAAVAAAFGLLDGLVFGWSWSQSGPVIAIAGLLALALFSLPQRAAERGRNTQWALSRRHVDLSTGSIRAEIRWSYFRKVVVQRRVILFVLPRRAVLVLPRRCLSLDDTERALSWVAAQNVPVILSDP